MLGNAFPTAGILTFSRVSPGSLLNTPSTLQFFIRVSQLRRNQPVTRVLTPYILGVRQTQTADLQTADLQTCRPADLQTCRLADLQRRSELTGRGGG